MSSSISNFREKLTNYLQLPEWHWWRNRNDKVIFFGLYHWKDYLRFIWHRGPKKVFWCGSDILALEKSPYWLSLIIKQEAVHYCENEVERDKLSELGFWLVLIAPMLFDDPDKYQISYKYPNNGKYFATYHKGREQEYGYTDWLQVDFLDGFTEEEFNGKIKDYQGAIRFNQFDGFAETLAKSVLMGQYPRSWIRYPHIAPLSSESYEEALASEPGKKPNYEASNYWRKTLKENKNEVVDNWSW